ncbi:hypothetical protein EW026_g313 [Hermanssonia centrifuga]|uniref:Uncharacterized protein n=1 Tax=Hermanssonia centrifuga TaxID=98765 RepID=A0A4S4KV17_9APHY|nr:hypothetical protein EW026_g313 [Hermanssonia centrifuga]
MSINGRMEPALQQTGEAWDADNLFAQHTIAEVKAVQQRLRLDADAKQEELRIMVGVGNGIVTYFRPLPP